MPTFGQNSAGSWPNFGPPAPPQPIPSLHSQYAFPDHIQTKSVVKKCVPTRANKSNLFSLANVKTVKNGQTIRLNCNPGNTEILILDSGTGIMDGAGYEKVLENGWNEVKTGGERKASLLVKD